MASTLAQVSLTAVSSGTGSTVDFTTAKKTVTAVVSNSGTITAGQVLVEASQDSLIWVSIGNIDIDQGVTRGVSFNGQAYRYWRARLVTNIAGGGSVRVTFMEAD